MPEIYKIIVNAVQKVLRVEIHAYDFHLQGSLFIKNIKKLLLEDAALMQGYEGPDSD